MTNPAAAQIARNAARVSPDQLEGFLLGACGDDDSLRAEVERCLEDFAGAQSAATLDTPPAEDALIVAPADARFRGPAQEHKGEIIGRYKLLEQIGEGGFGTVWAAEQREPVKRRVALKFIKLGMDTKQVIARFEAERQALAMMDHPNIAKVFDAGATEAGRPYFVMELVKGVPVIEYCDTEKLDTKARLALFIQTCHAIQHAHQKGIIHRDIKPSNVLITMHDGNPAPKVIDFGIAKATNQDLTDNTFFTQQRQMIGTPTYMSPEQADNTGLDIDTRSDIYALGVLLYEMLTGTTPFPAGDLMSKGFEEIKRIIRETEPHKPSTRLSSLGETGSRTAEVRRVGDVKKLGMILKGDLDWIVMKCLEKDRTRRYETANGLAADIERHINNEPVLASPPSVSYRFHKFVKRNKGQVVAAGVLAAALVLGMAGTTMGMVRAERAERSTKLELTRTAEVKRLITEMLSGIDPAKAKGADITLLKGILDETSERLTNGEVEDELIAAELHNVVGDVYYSLGIFTEAERHLPVALEIRSRLLGEEHPDTLKSMGNLATLYYVQGRYVEAEPLYLDTLEIRKRVLGDEHPETLASMGSLALLYYKQDRYPEAEPLYLETLEIKKRVLGDEHPDTLKSMNNLAILYDDQGRYAESEPLHLETLAIMKRVLGDEHPDTLTSMNNLAILYAEQGRYAEAEPLFLETLEISKRVRGDEHPNTLVAIMNLGSNYNDMERFEDATAMLEPVLPVVRRVVGGEHPFTQSAMKTLAKAYTGQGRLDEALPLSRELLNLELASANEPDANANILNGAAWNLLTHDLPELQDPARALALATRACAKEESAGGGSLYSYLDTRALAQHKTGDTAAAIETQRRAIALIPTEADPATREELTTNLHTYETALAEQANPAGGG